MVKIDRVVVFCSPRDAHLAEICIASIRYWNSTIQIDLHKDESRKKFSTFDIERFFNVNLCDSSKSSVGNPMSKFYYVTKGADIITGENLLVLDADTAWFGNVEELFEHEPNSLELIVQGEMHPSKEWMKRKYFDSELFYALHPELSLPSFVFNSGHFLIKVGSIHFDESQGLLTYDSLDTIDGIFPFDQGLFNFIHAQRQATRSIKSKSLEIAKWSGHQIDFSREKSDPFILHWAGRSHLPESLMDYAEQLLRYRKFISSQYKFPTFYFFTYRLKMALQVFLYHIRRVRLRILGKK